MRPVPTAPAEVIANAIFGDVGERVVQRLDADEATLLERIETHRHADAIPECRQPRIVDLDEEAGFDDHLIFGAHRLTERVEKFFLALVEFVVAIRLEALPSRG